MKNNKIFFPKELSYGEDLVFNMTYLKYCKKLFVTNKTYYNYRIENENSLSRKYRDDAFEVEQIIYKQLFSLIEEKKIKDEKLEGYYYRRYFDTAYNVILKNNKKIFVEKYRIIKNILKDEILKRAYKEGNMQGYSTKIIFLMKYKCSLMLAVVSLLYGRR